MVALTASSSLMTPAGIASVAAARFSRKWTRCMQRDGMQRTMRRHDQHIARTDRPVDRRGWQPCRQSAKPLRQVSTKSRPGCGGRSPLGGSGDLISPDGNFSCRRVATCWNKHCDRYIRADRKRQVVDTLDCGRLTNQWQAWRSTVHGVGQPAVRSRRTPPRSRFGAEGAKPPCVTPTCSIRSVTKRFT
jgi:hypothetical protein